MIALTLSLGGFLWAIVVAFYVNYERRILSASLIGFGLVCAGLGLLFNVMIGLHPYTWGLPQSGCQQKESMFRTELSRLLSPWTK